MQAMDDMALLREYATGNSEAAFETLVSRRVGFVYSAALRQVRDPNLAEEVTQAVFIILAQKAGRISGKTILAGWLFRTTRFAALAQMRADAKRRRREQEANMQSELQPTAPDQFWEQMSPLLDEALATLGETDRQAVLLRFFENKSLAEVGSRLGTGEDTARKRVSRALEKLHRYFSKHGVSSTTAAIAGAISSNSVQIAPVALAKTVTAVAVAKGAAASGSTLTLVQGSLKLMAWAKTKSIIIASATMIWVAATTTFVIGQAHRTNKSVSHDIGVVLEGVYSFDFMLPAGDFNGEKSGQGIFQVSIQRNSWIINCQDFSALTNSRALYSAVDACCDGTNIYLVNTVNPTGKAYSAAPKTHLTYGTDLYRRLSSTD